MIKNKVKDNSKLNSTAETVELASVYLLYSSQHNTEKFQ